jgi:nucleoside-diphosphate-sugar epimerase
MVGFPLCEYDRTSAETINLDSIETLLDLRTSNQRILYPCTNSGYGIGEKDKYCTEETPLRPISVYGKTKTAAEAMILKSGNSIAFRLATVFGASPRMRVDLLVNDFVYRAVHDRAVVIFEGSFKRNYIHVRDVVRAFIHGMNNFGAMKNEAYNVGLSSVNLSKLELCAKIKEFIPHFVYMESPIGSDPDKRDYIVSNEKIEKTGFTPQYTLEYGIKELIKAYSIIKPNIYSNI